MFGYVSAQKIFKLSQELAQVVHNYWVRLQLTFFTASFTSQGPSNYFDAGDSFDLKIV